MIFNQVNLISMKYYKKYKDYFLFYFISISKDVTVKGHMYHDF